MELNVRALDVGYGNVKFVRKHSSRNLKPVLDKFPSRAVISNQADISGGMMARRKTVHVDVEGTSYEVGYDVSLAQGTYDETTSLDKEFCKTAPYMARVLGALNYMYDDLGDRKVIDLLVCGLPVTTYFTYRDDMADILTGKFKLPDGKEVQVERISVIPQPLGAYFNFVYPETVLSGSTASNDKFKQQSNLVIDPGFFTFDWLASRGMNPNTKRSGSAFRGMSAVIRAMAEDISKKEKVEVNGLVRILDDALREGVTPRIFGQEIDLSLYKERANAVVNEAVNQLVNTVGDGADIDNIMVAGGGADFYIDAIKDRFPRHSVLTSEEPVYANVLGFQKAGLRQIMKIMQNQQHARTQPSSLG